MERFGYTEEELLGGAVNENFRKLMAFEVERARALFHEGLPLVDLMRGRAKLDVALFSMGGLSVLDAIERQGYDVLSRRPVVSSKRKLGLVGSTLLKLLTRRSLVQRRRAAP